MTLRAPEPSDVEFIYNVENDPDRLLQGNTGMPVSRRQIEQYVENYHAEALTSGDIRFIIEEEGVAIGIADLYDMDLSSSKAFVSIYIKPENRKVGLGLKALEQLVRFACDQLGLRLLAAFVSEQNAPSKSLFANAGFDIVATLPKWMRSNEGGFTDANVFVKFLR